MIRSTIEGNDFIVVPEYFYGYIVMDTRMRPEGNRLIGEGRSWHYNGKHELVKDTGWEPTGVVARIP